MARPTRLHFSDEDLDGELVRTLAMAVVSAADLGEAMAAAEEAAAAATAAPVPAGRGSR